MIGAVSIIVGGVVTAIFCFVVARNYRRTGKLIPQHWAMWVMMGLGSLAYSSFYTAVALADLSDTPVEALIPVSRLLPWLVLGVTLLMSISALWFVEKAGEEDGIDGD